MASGNAGDSIAAIVAAEVVEFTVAGRYARKYGGSRRASWGAIVGGIVHKLDGSPTFTGRPDRVAVEAALERIVHRMLIQREWDRVG